MQTSEKTVYCTEGGPGTAHLGRWALRRVPTRELPDKGEEAGAGAEAVVGIAGEVAAEHFFFVEEAEDDQRDDEEETRQRPPGAKRKGREEQHENCAEVHGRADEPVGSRGNDFLPFFDLDSARGETVLFHDPKGDQIPGEDEELGKNRQPKRDARPTETVIQSGEQQGRKDNQLCPSNDGFLLADLFLCAQPALHQLGIAVHEIDRGNRHGEEQDGHEDPALPIAEGTGGNEKKYSDENEGDEAAEDDPGLEAAWGGHELHRLLERQGENSRTRLFKFAAGGPDLKAAQDMQNSGERRGEREKQIPHYAPGDTQR